MCLCYINRSSSEMNDPATQVLRVVVLVLVTSLITYISVQALSERNELCVALVV